MLTPSWALPLILMKTITPFSIENKNHQSQRIWRFFSEGLLRRNCPTMLNVSNWHLKYYFFPTVSWKKSMHVSPWKMRNYTLPFSCPSLIKSLAIKITHFFIKIRKLKLFWKVFLKIIIKNYSLIFYKTKIYQKFEIFFS